MTTVLAILVLAFVGKVTQSLFHFMDGKVARSTGDMFDEYVEFPTISICMGEEGDSSSAGFKRLGHKADEYYSGRIPIRPTFFKWVLIEILEI